MAAPNPKFLHYIKFSITTACLVGFALSFYSLLVEMNLEKDSNYVAMCDINEHMSCSKAFNSQYGKGFGLIGKVFGEKSVLNQPNSLFGMVFYTLFFFMNIINTGISTYLMFTLALLSNLFSLYLACILIFILEDLCIVCIATYAVNATLLVLLTYRKYVIDGHNIEHAKKS